MPCAPGLGGEEASRLLRLRIFRLLAVALGYGYSALVLGAWGCGAFGNDPRRTSADFRGAFTDVLFAIADWSPGRHALGPFRDVFAEPGSAVR